MVDTQHFCLRWNNYQSSITSAFENLRDDEDFVDVTLACDGKSLKAHRVVLSACSPYFRELLKSTPCKHPVIVLQDVAFTDLHALVEFIYHGEVNVHQRSLSSFLKTAEVLRVSGLTQQHADDRDQLAQVQSLGIRTPLNHHQQSFTDKLVEEALFTSPASPTHGATVNQLLRRAASAHRRERRISSEPDSEQHKRSRAEHIIGNNNNNNNNNNMELPLNQAPPQVAPTDFSPSAMKNSMNNSVTSNTNLKTEIEGNGISSTERDSSSPSPGSRTMDDVKSEPMELLCGSNADLDNSTDSIEANNAEPTPSNNQLPQGPLSGGSSGGDHEEHDSHGGPTYLSSTESKLFATAAGSFNFSMAALAADPSGLGGLNQSLQGNSELAGTSQVMRGMSLPLPLSACHRCDVCGKLLSTKLTLKRHKEQQHLQPLNNAVCTVCHKVFRTLNSLNNHRSIYHRRMK